MHVFSTRQTGPREFPSLRISRARDTQVKQPPNDAAMMRQRSDDLYAKFRNTNCYVFDLVLLTSGYRSKDGIRRMTEAEKSGV